MSMFSSVVPIIGTAVVASAAVNIGNSISNNYRKNGPRPHTTRRPVTYSSKRHNGSSHRRTSHKQGYSVFR